MWGVFDAPIEETGLLTKETGKVWYDQLVGGLRNLEESELPKGATFGLDYPSTFRINTQVYLQWYVSFLSSPELQDNFLKVGTPEAHVVPRLQVQALSKGITLVRRHYPSVSDVLADHPSTTLLINCTGIGSLNLSDIKDTNLYPTRGQTLLVAEPKKPITRMYEMERVKYDSAIYLRSLA